MRMIAGSIARDHLAGSSFPAELGLFPEEDLVPDSFEFIPTAVLGLRDLSRAIAARYRRDGDEIVLYLIREPSPHAAAATLSAAHSSIAKRSTAAPERIGLGDGRGFRAEHRYLGTVWVVRSGSDLIVVAGADDAQRVEQTAAALLERLAANGQ
jgi:hypothetical protein